MIRLANSNNSYRSIFKATSIFGGVQVFNILVTLIRGKAVAILIGTTGMGLNGLLLSGLNLVKALTSLGISESAVKDMSLAYGSGDTEAMAKTYGVFRKWIWFTAFLGVFSSVLFAPVLSRFAFGDTSYAWAYVLLSATFIFGALSAGIYTVLRASRQISNLAKANIFGSIAGLLVSLPILYFYRINGIVPSIIAASFATFLISLHFRRKVSLVAQSISLIESFELGKPMVKMGISISLSALLGTAATFILSAYISNYGSLSELGLYNAGSSIILGYTSLVFTAMGTDYFPRLSSNMDAEGSWKNIVNQQAELLLIIIGIILVIMVAVAPYLIRLLLSKEFLAVKSFLIISAISIPFKGLNWCLGFVLLAKGNGKLFLLTELISNIIFLVSNLLCYYYFGLVGLAYSLVICYTIFAVGIQLVINWNYKFIFSKNVISLFIVVISPLIIIVLASLFLVGWQKLIMVVVCVIFVLTYQTIALNKRINFVGLLDKYLKK